MRRDIEQKWGKFSAREIAALKDNDDLVMQIQANSARLQITLRNWRVSWRSRRRRQSRISSPMLRSR